MAAALVSGCTGSDHGSLSSQEYDFAVAASHQLLDQIKDETLSAAYAVHQSANVSLRHDGCPRTVIRVTLVGDFPHSIVLPPAGQNATITAEQVFLDPETGRTCETTALNSTDLQAPEYSANLLPELD